MKDDLLKGAELVDPDAPREPIHSLPLELAGSVDVSSNTLQIGNLTIDGVGYGFPDATVYVRRVSGMVKLRDGKLFKVPGMPVEEIVISMIGDGWAQQHMEENPEMFDGMCFECGIQYCGNEEHYEDDEEQV
jgi:hypothetical protein